ncbi:MAG: hypothetical protein DMG13_23320 [Acidobacteria bacterium]|nr:MAG: hypothetical protein DMG13_23320 [Acidobacteriota bacterium]
MMSHEESVSGEDFPQRWPQVETRRAWWKHFRINPLMFQQIIAETNPEAELQTLVDFEKQFPQSKVLPD